MISQEKQSYQPLEKKPWFLRHQKKLQNEITYFLVILIHLIIYLTISLGVLSSELTDPSPVCTTNSLDILIFLFLVVYCLIHAFVILYLFKTRLKNSQDNLNVMRDCKILACVWITWIFIWTPFSLLEESGYIADFIVDIFITLSFLLTTGWSIVETFINQNQVRKYQELKEHAQKSPSLLVEGTTFQELLNSPELLKEFEKFLRGEWYVENLLLLQEILKWEENFNSASPETRFSSASTIFKQYIAEMSPFQANLSAINRDSLGQALKKAESDPSSIQDSLFAEVKKELMRVMEDDSFMRFRRKFLINARSSSNENSSIQ